MTDFQNLILCEHQSHELFCCVTACVKDGRLSISGQDFCNLAKSVFGDHEYEYYYSFDVAETLALEAALGPNDFRKALVDNFSGLEGCRNLSELCEKHDIKYSFFSC